jgi:immunity protein 8 of polymorphic toxin system
MTGAGESATVRPVLHSLVAPACGAEGLESYRPADPTDFAVQVMAFIGTGDGLVDSFDIVVCSPKWFAEHFPEGDGNVRLNASVPLRWSDGVLLGAGLVFMAEWSYEGLRAAVESICAQHEGPDWGSVAARVGRLLPWEFDYKYDRFVNEHPGRAFPPKAPDPATE